MTYPVHTTNNKSTPKSTELQFWNWFLDHQELLYHFEKDQETILNTLSFELSKIDTDLTFELGPILENGKREFVISAGGIRTAFPAVENVYNTCPKLEKWIITKFKPRRNPPLSEIHFANRTLRSDEIFFKLYKDNKKVGMLIFMQDFNQHESEVFEQIGYIYLDSILGEYDVETKIGHIEVFGIDSELFGEVITIPDLSMEFDKLFDKLGA